MKKIILVLSAVLIVGCGKESGEPSVSPIIDTLEGVEQESSKVLLSPRVHNYKVKKFFFKRETLPSTDKRYIEIQIKKILDENNFNNLNQSMGLKEILIKGKHLVLSKGHQQGIFEQLNKMTDISKLTIEAQTVDLFEDLHLPGTSVYISAHELNLAKKGSLDITPLGFSSRPKLLEKGRDGQNSGEIVLNIKKLNYDQNRRSSVFILNGGRGQDGSLGVKGPNGSRVRDLGNGVVFKTLTKEFCDLLDTRHFERERFNKRLVCSTHTSYEGSKVWPTDGRDAISGSRPGTGGRGGFFLTYVKFPRELVEVKGGLSGQSAGLIKGGEAGTPLVSYHQEFFINRNNSSQLKSTKKKVSSKGIDAVSPGPEKSIGEDGACEYSSLVKFWETEGYLEKDLLFATDLYINNHIEEARLLFSELDWSLNFKEIGGDSVKSMALKSKVNESRLKINSQKDYFGNSVNWVPNYSLEANFSKFKKDLEFSFKTLYMTYWIKNSQKSIESKVEAMEKVQSSLFEEIERGKEAYENLVFKIPLLKEKIDTFRVQEEYFSNEVRRVEKEINKMARENIIERHRVPFFKKALSSVAALSTAIPAGQPALGLIGSSLGILSSHIGTHRPLGDIISDSSSIYNNFQSLKLEESSQNWNEIWSKVKLNRVAEINNKDELKEYLNNLTEFSKPIIAAAKVQADHWRKREISRTEISAEIEKIKNTHSVFKDVTKSLKRFMDQKNVLVREVNTIQADILKTISSIYNNFDKVSELNYHKGELLSNGDTNMVSLLDSLEAETKSRILKYNYEVARAYEYRLLKPYFNNININSTIEKMKAIVEVDTEAYLSSKDFEALEGIYTSELAEIVDRTLTELNNDGLPLQREKVLQLNRAEVNALNSGKDIYLDLVTEKIFSDDMHDVRINKVLVEDLAVENLEELGRSAEVSLEIAYSGESFIKKGGTLYFFEKDTHKQKTKWGASLDLISGVQSEIKSSPSSDSLINSLIGNQASDDIMLLSRPGGLTQLKVRFRNNSNPKIKMKLHRSRIRIIYDYNTF